MVQLVSGIDAAIRGLGDVGHQPMHDNTEVICVTYNGEIYNYDELRNDWKQNSTLFLNPNVIPK